MAESRHTGASWEAGSRWSERGPGDCLGNPGCHRHPQEGVKHGAPLYLHTF